MKAIIFFNFDGIIHNFDIDSYEKENSEIELWREKIGNNDPFISKYFH